MTHLARFIWKLSGWTFIGSLDPSIKKFVMIMAPHTSNWDFVWGRLGLWMQGVKVHFLIKKEFFFFPVGIFLKSMGGIPVDRSNKKKDVPGQLCTLFEEKEQFGIMITPEGSRKYRAQWKKGFYKIASEADVPLVITFLDYARKEGGILGVFEISGDYQADLKKIEAFYFDKTAKYPQNFNLSPQYRKKEPTIE